MAEDIDADRRRREWNALAPIGNAIGRLCMQWAELEAQAVHLTAVLLGVWGDPARCAMLKCFGFRDHLNAIRVGAAATMDADWADICIAEVDYIDNTLRPRRNRYVHDSWDLHEDGVLRLEPVPKIYKEPGSGKRAWRASASAPETMQSVDATRSEISLRLKFMALLIETAAGDISMTPAELRREQPPQLLTPLPPGTPRQ